MSKKPFKELLSEAEEDVKKEKYENAINNLMPAAVMLGEIARPIVEILNRASDRVSEDVEKGDFKKVKNDLEFSIIMLEKMKEQKRQNEVREESRELQDRLWIIREMGRQK